MEGKMNRLCGLLLILLAMMATDASAQTTSVAKVLFLGPGVSCCEGSTETLHFGGGVEARVRDRVGIGGELGYMSALTDLPSGFGTWSANGSYYFASPVRRLRPFATGGYTMFFRTNDYLSLWNVGGGVEYAIRSRMALRLEGREQITAGGGEHFVNARFGLVIR
jgi:opacity protein-like surface antigen